jgi:hypothetical protein
VGGVEAAVGAQGPLAALFSVDNRPQFQPQGGAEVERRPDPLRGQWQAVAGGIAGEENSLVGSVPQLVGDPVALPADLLGTDVIGQQFGRLTDMESRVEGADPDPEFVVGGKGPGVTLRHVPAVDPDLEVFVPSRRVNLKTS